MYKACICLYKCMYIGKCVYMHVYVCMCVCMYMYAGRWRGWRGAARRNAGAARALLAANSAGAAGIVAGRERPRIAARALPPLLRVE